MDNKIIKTQNEMASLLDSVEISQVRNTLGKITQFQTVLQQTLKGGHDYGNVGGVTKPTLLKPGAEKILMLMGLTSEYEIIEKIEDYDKGIFAYTLKCTLYKNSNKITEGVGSCNSKEDKYRWRWVKEKELPLGIDKETTKTKIDNWGNTKYRIENDDICSQANTILKMAKKRAQVDATLTVASLSEIFTQDLEDMSHFIKQEQIENLDINSAESLKINFGKHKGKSLGEIMKVDTDYINWLMKNAREEVVKKAAKMIIDKGLSAPEEVSQDIPLPDETEMPF
jgi:hypothetical protein